MLRIMHVEEIADLLLLLPGVVQQQERRSIDFASNAGVWLKSLETVFTANRLYQAGSIAMLRSTLVAAEQGQAPAEIEFRGRPTRSRVMSAVALQALQRAAEIASRVIAENQQRFAEAERVAQQIIAAALLRGLITARKDDVSSTQYLRMLRRSLATLGELENAIVHLEGLVGPYDALVLLDRALALHLAPGSVAVNPTTIPSSS